MAVYTHLSNAEIGNFLTHYALGELRVAQPIAEGVENTNYRLETTAGSFILTLFEQRVKEEDLPFFMDLKAHLAAAGINCPTPLKQQNGQVIGRLKDRPAVIISFLPGSSVAGKASFAQLSALGEAMAKLHLAVDDFSPIRENALSPDRLWPLFDKTADKLNALAPGLQGQAQAALQEHQHWQQLGLPRGVVHADLFMDNVFFEGNHLSGIIDFYFACTDYFAYDAMITLNAWCFDDQRHFNSGKAMSLLSAYQQLRPFSRAEREALPQLARGAALRFFFTRAHDALFPVEGAVVTVKDPLEYWHKWQFWNENAALLEEILS